ncbi:MAG TPA: hypothetical protein VHZ98_02655 [Galbitalea sp.]|nr:hypothetical protein [Galbitalea sp.]
MSALPIAKTYWIVSKATVVPTMVRIFVVNDQLGFGAQGRC